jgi:transcriptional regulator with XRE-family HTH domain
MAAQIRLRTAQYRKFAKLKGWRNDDQAAQAIGVNPATLSRVLRGITAPGERFIAGVLLALPEVEFHDLFEVHPEDEQVPA